MGNSSSTEQQYQQQYQQQTASSSSRGRRHERGSATGASTAHSNGSFGSGPQPRHHKTRRSQESQRRRRRSRTQQTSASPSTTQRSRRSDDNSNSNSSSSDNSNSHNSNSSRSHSDERRPNTDASSPPPPLPPQLASTDHAGKIQHSLSDATTSSTGSSSPELLNAIDTLRVRVGPPPSPSHPQSTAANDHHADLLANLRTRYNGALPWLAHCGHMDGGLDRHANDTDSSYAGATAGSHPDSSMLGTVLHQLACLQWRDYVPCTRESEDADADAVAPPTSPASSTLPTMSSSIGSNSSSAKGNRVRSASSFFQSYDAKTVAEQKHKTFWELVQQLLTLNDAVVMIRLLLTYLQVHVDAAACAVFLIDQTTHVTSRFAPHETSVSGIDPARGVLGKTLATREAVCCMNFATADPSYDVTVDLDQTWPKQKLLCVPLIENDVVYAVIQATTKAPTRRDVDALHVKLLSWLGPILGACMRKCIEFHDVLLSDRTQKALLHIISSSDTEDTVLNLVDGVIAGACHITKAERVTLFMIDWDTDELWSLSSSYHAETLRLPLHASALGHAALTRTILNISDPASDARYSQRIDRRRGVPTRCALYVPVGVQNATSEGGSSRPIAVLEILNKIDGHEFTFDDECAFEAFASQVAVILRRRSNEIEYLKLLADTRAEKVLANRAKSQVNILEQYTSYSSTMRGHAAAAAAATAAAARRGSFARSPARDVISCTCRNGVPVDVQRCRLHNSGTGLTNASSWHRTLERQLSKSGGSSIPSWDFNVFLADMDALPDLVFDMFTKFSVPTVLGISKQRMRTFINVVRANYHPNPFHNFVHAFSVVHTAYLLLSTTSAARMLQPLDIAGCLIAALCHDVDHPGHTNAYEIQSGSQLAMLYSDESVLERHHAYTTFKLIAKEKNANILEHLSPSDYRHIRKVIITAILGTDMAGHFKFCETLEKTLHPPARHFSAASLVSSGSGTGGTGSSSVANGTSNVVGTAGLHKPLDNDKVNSASAGSLVGHTPSLASLSGLPGLVDTSSTSEIRNVLRDAVFQSEQGSAATTPRNNGSSSAPSMGFCFPKPFASAPSLATLATATASTTSTAHDKSASSISSDSCSTASNPPNNANGWNFTGSVDDRIFLVKTIVHASDLSGQVFTKPVALKWSNMISKEFAYQALLEQAENHPVSYHHLNDPLQMVEGQLFFAQKIVAPLWDLVHTLFPEVAQCVQNLSDNVAHYEHELQRLKIATSFDENDERFSSLSDALAINGSGGGVGSNTVGAATIGAMTIGSATIESLCFDDEGLAVPGLAKCTPARFNSFRSLREVSESFDEGDNTWNTELSLRDFAASAVAAIEREKQARRESGDDEDDDDDNDNAFDEFDAGDYAALMGVQT